MYKEFIYFILCIQKNREGTVIILYCYDEVESAECASLLINKGFDNVFLLTGGLLTFGTENPFYIDGELPKKRVPTSQSKRSGVNSAVGSKKGYFL